jgi:NUMOD3 motif
MSTYTCNLCAIFGLEECQCPPIDSYTIQQWKSESKLYNWGINRTGMRHSEESKALMSANMKGRIPWHKGKKGLYTQSEETKAKISAARRIQSDSEYRKRMSEALKGRKVDWGDKISKGLTGKKLSPEHVENIRQAVLRRDPSWKQQVSEHNRVRGSCIYCHREMSAKRIPVHQKKCPTGGGIVPRTG